MKVKHKSNNISQTPVDIRGSFRSLYGVLWIRLYIRLSLLEIPIVCILFQIRQFRKLYEHIKNDKYLVGQRLVNYDHRRQKQATVTNWATIRRGARVRETNILIAVWPRNAISLWFKRIENWTRESLFCFYDLTFCFSLLSIFLSESYGLYFPDQYM